jgi:hypothetical protein
MKKLLLVFTIITGILLFSAIDSLAQCRPRRFHHRRAMVYVAPLAPMYVAPAPLTPVVVVKPYYGHVYKMHGRRFRRW